ncbi:hypothetical protein GCM10023224_05060 [Streptomonospora halophila]|uniref:Tail terminator n=1 Tax=Streptomonospora halophila TaxID=427369 RepID=A0ABP9G5Q4_9ACTN
MPAPFVLFGDPLLVATTYLRDVLGAAATEVAHEPPGPEEYAAALPLVLITQLPSPPMLNRYALDVARLDVEVHHDGELADAMGLARLANAHMRALGGRTVELVTVSTVRNTTTPEPREDPNDSVRVAGFTCELVLRPIPQS